jgi:endonuclease YncB( thermonuclease family)
MTNPHLLLALLLSAAPAFAAPPKTETRLTLKVVSVHDGDTFTGLNEANEQVKVWLDAVDAPELGQPYGQSSKKALSERILGRRSRSSPRSTTATAEP